MTMEAVVRDVRHDADPDAVVPDLQPDPAAEMALIVILSPSTVKHVDQIARAGWEGPVLAVGSVEEARQLLVNDREDEPERHPYPVPSRPRLAAAPAPPEPLRGLRLDPDQRRIVHGDRDTTLTPLEFGVLELLMQAPGQVLRFDELTRLVWGTAFTGDSAHLHAVVGRLRRKLEAVRAPVELAAVRGVGFRLTGQVAVDAGQAQRARTADPRRPEPAMPAVGS